MCMISNLKFERKKANVTKMHNEIGIICFESLTPFLWKTQERINYIKSNLDCLNQFDSTKRLSIQKMCSSAMLGIFVIFPERLLFLYLKER